MSVSNMPNIFIMPHIDDETFSCGGILTELKNKNPTELITVCAGRINDSSYIKALRLKALKNNTKGIKTTNLGYYDLKLGITDIPEIADKIYNILNDYEDINSVYIPAATDLHQDHKIVNNAARIACVKFLRAHNIIEINEVLSPFLNLDNNTRYTLEVNVDPILKKEMVDEYITEHTPEVLDKEYINNIWQHYSTLI